jgi:hypothetical protein
MKTMTKRGTRRQSRASKKVLGSGAALPADLEEVDWDFRIEPPPSEAATLRVRFV